MVNISKYDGRCRPPADNSIIPPFIARVEEERVHPPDNYRSKREGGVYMCVLYTVQYIRTDCRLLVPLISPSKIVT